MKHTKTFKIYYGYKNSVWTNQFATVEAINLEQAKKMVRDEHAGAYGSEIMKDFYFEDQK